MPNGSGQFRGSNLGPDKGGYTGSRAAPDPETNEIASKSFGLSCCWCCRSIESVSSALKCAGVSSVPPAFLGEIFVAPSAEKLDQTQVHFAVYLDVRDNCWRGCRDRIAYRKPTRSTAERRGPYHCYRAAHNSELIPLAY